MRRWMAAGGAPTTPAARATHGWLLLVLAVTVSGACADSRDHSGSSAQREDVHVVRALPVAPPSASPSAPPSPMAPDDAIDIGYVPSDASVAISALWAELLRARKHTVRLIEVSTHQAYAEVANGSLDLFLSARLPAADAAYWQTYGDRIEDLGAWYENAALAWVVPDYVALDSLAELRGRADQFGHRVIGVEAESRVMRVSQDQVLAAYGLQDEYEVLAGSTDDMLAELLAAMEEREPIVATLEHPHWASVELPIKALEDPDNAFGAPDGIHVLASQGFGERFPEVREVVDRAVLDGDKVAELQIDVLNAGPGDEADGVAEWLAYPDCKALTDEWFAG